MKNACPTTFFEDLSSIVRYCNELSPEIVTLYLYEDGLYIGILSDRPSGRHTDMTKALYKDLLKNRLGWLEALKEKIEKDLKISRGKMEK